MTDFSKWTPQERADRVKSLQGLIQTLITETARIDQERTKLREEWLDRNRELQDFAKELDKLEELER